jgi:flavodoxin
VSRILVVCYSRGGTTLEVASRIAERCGADLELIKDRTPRDGLAGWLRSAFEAVLCRQPWIQPPRRAVGDYALVIVGTPVWAGRMASPVRSYLMRQQGRLRRVALFCTHGGRGGDKVLAEMEALCGRRARATLSLAARNLTALGNDVELTTFVRRVAGDRDAPTTSGAPLSDHAGL